jgi:hypothetical protein
VPFPSTKVYDVPAMMRISFICSRRHITMVRWSVAREVACIAFGVCGIWMFVELGYDIGRLVQLRGMHGAEQTGARTSALRISFTVQQTAREVRGYERRPPSLSRMSITPITFSCTTPWESIILYPSSARRSTLRTMACHALAFMIL